MKNIELRHDNHQIQYGSNQCEKMSVFPNEKDTLPIAIWVLRMLLLTKSAVNDVFLASKVHFQRIAAAKTGVHLIATVNTILTRFQMQ